jgi:hypothetical protein
MTLAEDERATFPPDPPRSARRGPRPSGHTLALIAAVAVAAGILGILIAGLGGPDRSDGYRTATGGGFEVRHPRGWQREPAPPRIPGLPALGPGSVYLTGDDGRTGFFAVTRAGELSAAIPPTLAARLGSSAVKRSRAHLRANVEAYEWISVGATRVELFAVPSSGATMLAGCAALPTARPQALQECRQMVAGLRPAGRPMGGLQPNPLYAATLRRTIVAVGDAERRARGQLRAARTAGGQAADALRAARRLQAARRELAAATPNAPARGWHQQAASALGEIGGGYAALAKAFGTRDRAKLARAMAVIQGNQRRLVSALSALTAIGYESAPVSDPVGVVGDSGAG